MKTLRPKQLILPPDRRCVSFSCQTHLGF